MSDIYTSHNVENGGIGLGFKMSPYNMDAALEKDYFSDNPDFLVSKMSEGAAYRDLGNGKALFRTVNYFPRILENLYDFGMFAATNALNEGYAKGGNPITAHIIAGWPKDKYTQDECMTIMRGANKVCEEAGIKITGGYATEAGELFFGLSVDFIVDIDKCSRTSRPDVKAANMYLTKPLGIEFCLKGQREGIRTAEQNKEIIESVTKPNSFAPKLLEKEYIRGMVNISFLGVIGSLCEVTTIRGTGTELFYHSIPKMDGVDQCIDAGIMPQGTIENWQFFKDSVSSIGRKQSLVLSDPQSCGNLLIVVDSTSQREFEDYCREHDITVYKVGRVTERGPNDKNVVIK
ncbi:MAG: selenide, water dikinase SelD [Marinifilaceae bacterium]|jgi:selenide,water dikinase|nr:selenide, water dikinase SelD [Marinifilaceae bacterium]